MSDLIEDFSDFLDRSPTSWHAVHELGNRLASLDITPLDEVEKWELEKGQKYFVERGGSLCVFTLPEKTPAKVTILGAHTDSPALKLKPSPEVHSQSIHLLETEVYGAPLLSSWFNRDLAIAGRLVVENNQGQLEDHLIFLDQTPLFIPQLALHLDREVNDKGLMINKQDHLRPVFTLKEGQKDLLEPLLKKHVSFKDLLAFDLFLVPLEKSRLLGISGEMVASYRLDNLASSHACITAIASAEPSDGIQMVALWDGEEIGSRTAEGAASPFVEDILKRIATFYKLSEEDFICMKNRSLCISVDVAHAYNPNFSKKYDQEHQLIPGQGIAVKYNADKKYVTDAKTAAAVISACKKLGLRYQSFASRSDMPSGSTIGPIFAHTLGIPTVDIGSPIFSMHSAREVMAVQDHIDMCQLLTHLLQ
jgi:aspartyl aminopeptidase